MEADAPCSVGLVGDGDEVAAIGHIEEVFGITLDDRDAPRWVTAGDVYASLLETLPPDRATDAATWNRFAQALARETGIDPALVSKDSPLLLEDQGFWAGFKEPWGFVAFLWGALLLLVIVL